MMQTERMVDPNVLEKLPKELIEYLWKLAKKKKMFTTNVQYFILRPEELAGQEIQDVVHQTPGNLPAVSYRVFGIKPVSCKVKIQLEKNCEKMVLLGFPRP